MIAVDTNIIVRLLTGDDPVQSQKAKVIFSGDDEIFIPDTVILESEWVLRFAYKFEADAINAAFTKLLGLANVRVSQPKALATALDWHRQGVDFADALHLTTSHEQKKFLTFDSRLIRKARGLSSCRVEAP